MAPQITSITIAYSTVYLGADQGEWNSPVTGELPAQKASNAEIFTIWWRHHVARYIWRYTLLADIF